MVAAAEAVADQAARSLPSSTLAGAVVAELTLEPALLVGPHTTVLFTTARLARTQPTRRAARAALLVVDSPGLEETAAILGMPVKMEVMEQWRLAEREAPPVIT